MKTLIITDYDFGANDKNFNYILGFQPSFGAILIGKNTIRVFLDSRYFDNTKNIDEENIRTRLNNKNLKIKYIKIDSKFIDIIADNLKGEKEFNLNNNIPVKYYSDLKDKLDAKINFIDNPLGNNRIIKNDSEKENLKKAIKIIDKVFLHIESLNNSGKLFGKTEMQIRQIIVTKIFEYGGEGESFEAIVAFGQNSATPHHEAGNTVIKEGVLLIDMGALYRGYCSDFTRTFWTSPQPSPEGEGDYNKFIKIKNIVKEAHNLAFNQFKIGMTGDDLDKIARDYIEEKGYGEYFSHSLGHGVGLDIHEIPWVSKKAKNTLENGMFFTIEPGIYLPENFGVRLEDIVYVENGKLKKFSEVEL